MGVLTQTLGTLRLVEGRSRTNGGKTVFVPFWIVTHGGRDPNIGNPLGGVGGIVSKTDRLLLLLLGVFLRRKESADALSDSDVDRLCGERDDDDAAAAAATASAAIDAVRPRTKKRRAAADDGETLKLLERWPEPATPPTRPPTPASTSSMVISSASSGRSCDMWIESAFRRLLRRFQRCNTVDVGLGFGFTCSLIGKKFQVSLPHLAMIHNTL